MGLGAYLDLALIFLLLRFSLLILFFLHLALIALAHFWNNQVVDDQETKEVTVEHRGQYMDLELDGFGGGFSLGLGLLVGLVLLALALLLNLRGMIDEG